MSFYTILTRNGQDLLTEALGLGLRINLTHMAVGDGGGVATSPNESQTALINEVYRAGVTSLVVDPANPNWLVAELIIPTEVGGFSVREIGLFDTNGNMFAVGNFPETYKPVIAEGSGREITVRMTIQVSDTASVTLTIDKSVIFATRTYADASINNHAGSRDHPTATTTARGFVELATTAEAKIGGDLSKAVTPRGVRAVADGLRSKTYFMGQ